MFSFSRRNLKQISVTNLNKFSEPNTWSVFIELGSLDVPIVKWIGPMDGMSTFDNSWGWKEIQKSERKSMITIHHLHDLELIDDDDDGAL